MIAAIVFGKHLIGMSEISHQFVKINYCIEMAASANPPVDCQPVSLVGWGGMVISRAHIWKNSGPDSLDPVGMRSRNDLFIGPDYLLHERVMLSAGPFTFLRQLSKIVHAFEDNQITCASLCEHIAIEARQRIWAKAIRQKMVPSDALI